MDNPNSKQDLVRVAIGLPKHVHGKDPRRIGDGMPMVNEPGIGSMSIELRPVSNDSPTLLRRADR